MDYADDVGFEWDLALHRLTAEPGEIVPDPAPRLGTTAYFYWLQRQACTCSRDEAP